ncbi:MAG: hypothetical protein KA297_00430 [Kofleriaceae bacterium]|jgi:hypothetical protein|nr:hypothetical protein [Kofleriaceae bacterium]
MNTIVRRLLLTVVVLVVLSPTMALAAEGYRCQADGQVRAACCCPGEAEEDDAPADAPPDARSACCCDITPASATSSGPRLTADVGGPLTALAVPRAVAVVQLPLAERAQPPAPTVARPPLFLAHCSLLI